MRIVGFYSDKDLDRDIVRAVIEGARSCGEDAEAFRSADYPDVVDCDAIVLLGVKGRARYQQYRAAGVQTILLDKGYVRRPLPVPPKRLEFWRVAVNAHHPTSYLPTLEYPSDRWAETGIKMRPWRESGRHIVLAGSSQKFHDFNDAGDATDFAQETVNQIAARTGRPIVYRPKPSWRDAVPVSGAAYSPPNVKIESDLESAHALVTYGSNACFEAVVLGVPAIVLGTAVARPISSVSLDDIETPRLADDADRLRWLSNLAYCQWRIEELASGQAWPHIRALLN